MAERRMFAKAIIDSDAFLDMPLSAQALYFHLGMRADDDGFVNSPKKIMRLVSCSDDDMKLLIAKNFIIPFDSGIVVIKHWRIHNYIQKDRYHETNYLDEKAMLTTKENGSYSLLDTPCIQDVSEVDTEVRLGKSKSKNRLGKDSQDDIVHPKPSELREEFDVLWSMYPKKQGKVDACKHYQKARKSGTTYEEVGRGICAYNEYIKANRIDMQYVKMGSTFFSQKSWQDDWSIRHPRQESRNDLFARLYEEHKNDV